MDKNTLIKLLFSTEALKFSPEDQPFWYTSGTFGPYYLNTHYLFGGAERATEFLQEIERARAYPEGMPNRLFRSIDSELHHNPDFAAVIDALAKTVSDLDFDLISGGERRDFYFSLPLANRLSVPHITILKDGSTYISNSDLSRCRLLDSAELAGQKVLHVADLLNTASSYLRAWLPALERCGAKISDTAVVISRLQGGEEILKKEGVQVHSVLDLDQDFFNEAYQAGQISEKNRDLVLSFQADPKQYMHNFLAEHPDFLERSKAMGEREKERVQRFLNEFRDLI
ncbi:MAG: phosphoribosyltransferase family protein [Eubacteriales bacterium]|nr:phosphoribosyltransferase family protein [Eubacteriales bacterium]